MTRRNSTLITKIQRAFVVFKINLRTVVCFNLKSSLQFSTATETAFKNPVSKHKKANLKNHSLSTNLRKSHKNCRPFTLYKRRSHKCVGSSRYWCPLVLLKTLNKATWLTLLIDAKSTNRLFRIVLLIQKMAILL